MENRIKNTPTVLRSDCIDLCGHQLDFIIRTYKLIQDFNWDFMVRSCKPNRFIRLILQDLLREDRKHVLDYHIVKKYGVSSNLGDRVEIFCVKSLIDFRVFHVGQKTNLGVIYKFEERDYKILIYFKEKEIPNVGLSDIKIVGDI